MDNSAAVSEVIGAVLLISLVVVSIGIVAAILFGQQTPTKTPNLNFMTGVNSTKTTLYLSHTGGDTLNLGEFKVLLDGVPATSLAVSGGGNQWSLGTTLIVPISKVPQNVQIVYNGTAGSSGGGVLLREAASDIVSTVNVSADQLPYLDCSAVRNWACADQIPDDIVKAQYKYRTEAMRVSFMKQQTGGGLLGASVAPWTPTLTIVVNDTTGQSIVVLSKTGNNCGAADIVKNLTQGDILTITQQRDIPAFFIFYGMSPQVWEMAGNAWVNITYHNGGTPYESATSGDLICHTFINTYSDLQSTLIVRGTDAQRTETNLVINNSMIINGLNSDTITLYNFTPTKTDVYLLESVKSGQSAVYFIGWPAGGIYNNSGQMRGLGL